MIGGGIWRAEYLEHGGPRAFDGPGWYGHKTERTGFTGALTSSFSIRFETEEECRKWCDERNPPGVSSAPFDYMREYGRRVAMEREAAFWSSFFAATEPAADEPVIVHDLGGEG